MDITSANAVMMLSANGLFPTPQQIQGFAAEDIYETEPIETAEVLMGVDGRMSAGFIYKEIQQVITLQADSEGNDIFAEVNRQTRANVAVFPLQMQITLRAVRKRYIHRNGVIVMFPPIPNAKRVLQPLRYTLKWESIDSEVLTDY